MSNKPKFPVLFEYQIDDSGLNALLHTTLLTEELISTDPLWASINIMYESPRFEVRALAATLNAIMTQKRIFFVMSRSVLGKLLANDGNIPTRSTDQVKHETEYKKYLRLFYDEVNYPWFKCHLESKKNSQGAKGNAFIFEIVFDGVLNWIESKCGTDRNTLYEKQVQQLKKFCFFPAQVERAKVSLSKEITDFVSSRSDEERNVEKQERSQRFRRQIGKIIFSFINEVEADEESIDKLSASIDLSDSCIRANVTSIIKEGIARFNSSVL